MESENKNKIGAARKSAFEKIEKIHPVKMLLYLCLIGVTVMFIILTVAFARTEADALSRQFFVLPKFFSVSALLLLMSSFTLSKTRRYYRKDNLKKLGSYLGFTLALGFGFIVSQAAGWYELTRNGIFLSGKAAGSYLYLISALHALHLLGGIVFLIYFYFTAVRSNNDVVRMLVFIRNPFRRLQLDMLTTYWHFMDGLWVCLFVFMLFMF